METYGCMPVSYGSKGSPENAEADVGDMFRAAMRRFATTVTIVSTRVDDECFGMTATSVASVSMEPPSLLVGVKRTASIHGPILRSRAFCINLLDSDQAEHCAAFSGRKKGEERFSSGRWGIQLGVPYLMDAQACVFCRLEDELSYGTHTIFIGRVMSVQVAEGVSPLIYLDGEFVPPGDQEGACATGYGARLTSDVPPERSGEQA